MNGSSIVIDASIVLRWFLPDPLSETCWRLFERSALHGEQITAPTLLAYEVVSGLTKAVYSAELSPDDARQSLTQFHALEAQLVEADMVLSRRAFEWTIRLKRVASYDSYYLALAESLSCELWTADRKLFNAARVIHLDWVHWIEEA